MRSPDRQRLQRCRYHIRDLLVRDRPRGPRARLVEKTVETTLGEASPPGRDRHAGGAKPLRDHQVADTFGCQQHNLSPHGIRPGHFAPP